MSAVETVMPRTFAAIAMEIATYLSCDSGASCNDPTHAGRAAHSACEICPGSPFYCSDHTTCAEGHPLDGLLSDGKLIGVHLPRKLVVELQCVAEHLTTCAPPHHTIACFAEGKRGPECDLGTSSEATS
jgi:hypothetical protein